jgi:hypothetical protein
VFSPVDSFSHHSASGGMFSIDSLGGWSPVVLTERFPLGHVPAAARDTVVVLGHALGAATSAHDVQFAADSIIPTFIALSYFNLTSHPMQLLLWHPPTFHSDPTTPAPAPSLARSRAAASSSWLPPLTPLPILTAHDLPATACFANVLVGHESAFRLTSRSDAVRGIALRRLRNTVLRHYSAHAAASSALQINLYYHASAASRSMHCDLFSRMLHQVASEADKHCVDVDAIDSFAAAALTVSRAHLHVLPSDLPHAPMLLLARDSAAVFVVHAEGSSPERVAAPLQLLGDLPWLQVTHVWASDPLFHALLLEAVGDAAIKARISSAEG